MPNSLDTKTLLPQLRVLQADLRASLRAHMSMTDREAWSRAERDEEGGDTIFGLDFEVEQVLIDRCHFWGKAQHFTLLAEGLDPAGVEFGQPGMGGPPFRLMIDPIDGTRGLMFDKRSAWCLMAVAPDHGAKTWLSDVELAVMTELPTTRQSTSDVLWAVRGEGAHGERHNVTTGQARKIPVLPSRSTDLRNGFVTVANYFQGGKVLTAQLEEWLLEQLMGPWNPAKAQVYSDQYICSGGQLAELALGRDRVVIDLRPLVHQKLGHPESLCCKPYDLCTMLIAQEAGCVVEDPRGGPLDVAFDITTNVPFAAYCNAGLAQRIAPVLSKAVAKFL